MNPSFLSAVLLLTIFVSYGVNGDTVKERTRDEKCGDDLTWSLTGGILTVKGTGPMYNFTDTDSPWYEQRDDIINVVIENGVSSIGNYAFFYCANLARVSLPTSLEIIGTSAFASCSYLSEANIPDNVISIGDTAFQMTNLSQVTFPTALTSIGICAFRLCDSLTHVFIPATLSSIGAGVFSSCSSLASIEVDEGNDNFKSVGGVLFDFDSTTLIQYPAGMTDDSYVIPNTVKSLGDGAFSGCEHLINVTIPTSVAIIGLGSFNSCVNLKNINIPSSVISIGNSAFGSCVSLTSISIPSSVQTFGDSVIFNCTGLTHIDLPDSIPYIGAASFFYVSSLTELVIPSCVKYISSGAFFRCDSLKNVTFMNGLESIKSGAFSNCPKIVDLIFPESLKSIDSGAFSLSGLSHITLPSGVENIGAGAFSGCPDLSAVFYLGSEDFPYAFAGCTKLKDVCVPSWYSPATFCGLDVTRDHEICQTFQKLINDCSLPAYSGDDFVEQKRKNTTEWESRTNGCMEYKCDSKYGFVSWSVCNSSDKLNLICVKNECINEERVEKKVYVEIEMQEGVSVGEINVTEILETISELCNISPDGIEIGYEGYSDGFITRTIVYVHDEDTANTVMNALETIDKGESCGAGVLCKSKAIHIIVSDQSVSSSEQNASSGEQSVSLGENSLSLGARIEAIVMNTILLIIFVINQGLNIVW